MHVNVQNRSLLYKEGEPELVPEGVYAAMLADVRRFTNAFGERVGLVFAIEGGPHHGIELMESAALKGSSRGKLAELLRGIGGAEGSLLAAHELVGKRCRIAVRHEFTKSGKPYAAIRETFG